MSVTFDPRIERSCLRARLARLRVAAVVRPNWSAASLPRVPFDIEQENHGPVKRCESVQSRKIRGIGVQPRNLSHQNWHEPAHESRPSTVVHDAMKNRLLEVCRWVVDLAEVVTAENRCQRVLQEIVWIDIRVGHNRRKPSQSWIQRLEHRVAKGLATTRCLLLRSLHTPMTHNCSRL